MDMFLVENRQPDFNAPNRTVFAHQNVNVDVINTELNMLENSIERQRKY